MMNEGRDIQRKLRVLQNAENTTMRARPAGVLGAPSPASIDGAMRPKCMVKSA